MKNQEAVRRLKSVEGHIRGIQRMLEEGQYCIDVINQVNAVQAALNKVSTMILDDHLNSCVISAVRGENVEERERVLNEITSVFAAGKKI